MLPIFEKWLKIHSYWGQIGTQFVLLRLPFATAGEPTRWPRIMLLLVAPRSCREGEVSDCCCCWWWWWFDFSLEWKNERVAVVHFKLFKCSGPIHGTLPGGLWWGYSWLDLSQCFWRVTRPSSADSVQLYLWVSCAKRGGSTIRSCWWWRRWWWWWWWSIMNIYDIYIYNYIYIYLPPRFSQDDVDYQDTKDAASSRFCRSLWPCAVCARCSCFAPKRADAAGVWPPCAASDLWGLDVSGMDIE